MSARGVHFALKADDEKSLLDLDEDEREDFVVEEIEERWEPGFVLETDKAWDGIHRCLNEGELLYEHGHPILRKVIIGGRLLSEDEYIISYITKEEVKTVAADLKKVTIDTIRKGYDLIDEAEYGEKSEEDLEYIWECFETIPPFFEKAAKANRAIIFTVSE